MVTVHSHHSKRQSGTAPKVLLNCLIYLFLLISPALAFGLPTVTMTLDDGALAEANQDPGSFTVTRSDQGNVAAALDVYLTFADTAVNGTDYDTTEQHYVGGTNNRRVVIPADQLSLTSVITPRRDNLVEGEEAAVFTLVSDDSQYVLGSDIQVEMTIADFVDLMFSDGFEEPETG